MCNVANVSVVTYDSAGGKALTAADAAFVSLDPAAARAWAAQAKAEGYGPPAGVAGIYSLADDALAADLPEGARVVSPYVVPAGDEGQLDLVLAALQPAQHVVGEDARTAQEHGEAVVAPHGEVERRRPVRLQYDPSVGDDVVSPGVSRAEVDAPVVERRGRPGHARGVRLRRALADRDLVSGGAQKGRARVR